VRTGGVAMLRTMGGGPEDAAHGHHAHEDHAHEDHAHEDHTDEDHTHHGDAQVGHQH
jgi:hypothetical protein